MAPLVIDQGKEGGRKVEKKEEGKTKGEGRERWDSNPSL